MNRLIFISIFIASTTLSSYAQQNSYHLSEGLIRYYTDPCISIGFACIATEFYNLGIETVLEDTTINNTSYHKVLWEWRFRFQSEPELSKTEIGYFRFIDGILFKYASTGDTVVQDYNFAIGDSLLPYFNHLDWAKNGMPDRIMHDTLATLFEGSNWRILWADLDSTSAQELVDSVLVTTEWDSNLVLPIGNTKNFSFQQPFFFIDSIGVFYSGLTHRSMALVGIEFPDGKLYGSRVDFPTAIEEPSFNIYFNLFKNYPNPFNPKTTIEFQLEQSDFVELSIFDINGKKVIDLIKEKKSIGKHSVQFDGTNLASGLYFYHLKTGSFEKIKKMLLIK